MVKHLPQRLEIYGKDLKFLMNLSQNASVRRPSNDIVSFLAGLKDGQHGCLFYVNEQDKQRIQYEFLKSGLSQNSYCIYATSTEDVETVKRKMKDFGLDYANSYGNLEIVHGEDLYGPDVRRPNKENWVASVNSAYERALKQGKKSLRIAADLSTHFMSMGLEDQWYELESMLEKRFDRKITIICAYNASAFSANNTLQIIDFYKSLSDSRRKFIDAHSVAIISIGTESNLILQLA